MSKLASGLLCARSVQLDCSLVFLMTMQVQHRKPFTEPVPCQLQYVSRFCKTLVLVLALITVNTAITHLKFEGDDPRNLKVSEPLVVHRHVRSRRLLEVNATLTAGLTGTAETSAPTTQEVTAAIFLVIFFSLIISLFHESVVVW